MYDDRSDVCDDQLDIANLQLVADRLWYSWDDQARAGFGSKQEWDEEWRRDPVALRVYRDSCIDELFS